MINNILEIEAKVDTPEKLAAAAGKPTANFLFAEEFNMVVETVKQKEDANNKSNNPQEAGDNTLKFWSIQGVKDYIQQWWSVVNFKTINNASILGTGNINTTPADASETVAGIVSIGTQTFKGNKILKGESATTGNTLEVQNSAGTKILEVQNSEATNSLIKLTKGSTLLKIINPGGGAAKLILANTSGVTGYTKTFSLGDGNQWDIETEYYTGYGIGFINKGAGNSFSTSSLYIGAAGTVANRVGIGTINPQAKLDVVSTTSGFLPPRMTEAQRLAISLPADGLIVYQTDATFGLYIKNTAGWVKLITT